MEMKPSSKREIGASRPHSFANWTPKPFSEWTPEQKAVIAKFHAEIGQSLCENLNRNALKGVPTS